MQSDKQKPLILSVYFLWLLRTNFWIVNISDKKRFCVLWNFRSWKIILNFVVLINTPDLWNVFLIRGEFNLISLLTAQFNFYSNITGIMWFDICSKNKTFWDRDVTEYFECILIYSLHNKNSTKFPSIVPKNTFQSIYV